jgi:hypothetical protein
MQLLVSPDGRVPSAAVRADMGRPARGSSADDHHIKPHAMPATDTPTTIIEHDDRLLTVKELAERLGRRPRWVYANADALGAIRVGEGKHPQLHFQLPIVRARLAELAARPAESPAPASASTPAPGPAKPRRAPATQRLTPNGLPLLPVRRRPAPA